MRNVRANCRNFTVQCGSCFVDARKLGKFKPEGAKQAEPAGRQYNQSTSAIAAPTTEHYFSAATAA